MFIEIEMLEGKLLSDKYQRFVFDLRCWEK